MSNLLYFITPAWQRYELSTICFEARVWAISKLKAAGIEARCVVIADDQNLEIARSFGFDTVWRDNEYLGQRFNDGHEFAAKQGATHVVPVGSDSFLDPTFLIGNLPGPKSITCSPNYAVVDRRGLKRQNIRIDKFYGVTYCLNVQALKQRNYRPCRDNLHRGCDTSTVGSLGKLHYKFREVHDLECVAFQSAVQITQWQKLAEQWGAKITHRPFSGLDEVYPVDLVNSIKAFYREKQLAEQAHKRMMEI